MAVVANAVGRKLVHLQGIGIDGWQELSKFNNSKLVNEWQMELTSRDSLSSNLSERGRAGQKEESRMRAGKLRVPSLRQDMRRLRGTGDALVRGRIRCSYLRVLN